MILDADVLIDLLRGKPQARTWLTGLDERPAVFDAATAAVTVAKRAG